MSYASNDEIRGVLISAGAERVLLPNATVAEMMSKVAVQSVPDAPAWLVGQIAWHGWDVPLLSFARLSGLGDELVTSRFTSVVAIGNEINNDATCRITIAGDVHVTAAIERVRP